MTHETATTSPMDRIGRYRITRRIGAGSFATVWLGHDDDLDVPVAVKILADNWAGNDDVRQRFLAEARIMRRIGDERIVRVYDIGALPDGRPYFVMDYVSGGSLDDLRKEGVEPERALRLCAEAARALQVLHESHIIHRDLTPANVLLSRTESGKVEVLIADLGVAKSMIDAVGATATAGTPTYMAFEQAAGIGLLDPRADIYSLTAVTYALLTGHPPFAVRGLSDLLTRNPNARPEPIAAQLGAPDSLDDLLAAGLSLDRERRPPTAANLAQALEAIADRMHQTQTAISPVPVSIPSPQHFMSAPTLEPQPAQPPQQRPASFFILIGLGALALFAITLLITVAVLK